MADIEQLTDPATWQQVRSDPGLSLVFKHSTTCPISKVAHEAFLHWAPSALGSTVKLYRVYVIEDRSLSREIADDTGIPHQSPQALLMQAGKVLWHASHWAITEESLSHAVADPDTARSHSTGLMEAQAEHREQERAARA